jgi:hypothetical protein
VESGRIAFTPKSVVDRGVAESLADFAAGRAFGPFKTDKDLINFLCSGSTKIRTKARASRKTRK